MRWSLTVIARVFRWLDGFVQKKDSSSLAFMGLVAFFLVVVGGYHIGKHLALSDAAICRIDRNL